jgi:hypothetical protein
MRITTSIVNLNSARNLKSFPKGKLLLLTLSTAWQGSEIRETMKVPILYFLSSDHLNAIGKYFDFWKRLTTPGPLHSTARRLFGPEATRPSTLAHDRVSHPTCAHASAPTPRWHSRPPATTRRRCQPACHLLSTCRACCRHLLVRAAPLSPA